MTRAYFQLQTHLVSRRIRAAGLHPILALLLSVLLLFGGGYLLFQKTEFAGIAVMLIAASAMLKLSEKKRNEFLISSLGSKVSLKIRLCENLLVSFPFLVFLLLHLRWREAGILFLLGGLLANYRSKRQVNFVLPTPFSQRPFEFVVGFRKSFLVLLCVVALAMIGVGVENYNLGYGAMILIGLVGMGFYTWAEEEFYVWVHHLSPKQFLFHKIKQATLNLLLLLSPFTLFMLFVDLPNWWVIVMINVLATFLLWAVVLAKYAAYPKDMGVPEGILIVLALQLPPLVVILIPYFYKKAIAKAKNYLDD